MARLVIALLMVVAVVYVAAQEPATTAVDTPSDDDDDHHCCEETRDCACGSVCNDGKCEAGCMLFDTFMTAGSEAELYGRKCKCGDTSDERGMPLECEENVEFTGAPTGVVEWENNPACEV